MIPAKAVCVSNVHTSPVVATVHGAFIHPTNPANTNQDVWYCEDCAKTGEWSGMFTRNGAAK